MFDKPLLNNVLRVDHGQLQKGSDFRVYWVLCQHLPPAKLDQGQGQEQPEERDNTAGGQSGGGRTARTEGHAT